jgi:hypothetical protein
MPTISIFCEILLSLFFGLGVSESLASIRDL